MVILEIRLHFLSRVAWTKQSSYFMLPTIAGITGTHHHTLLFLFRWDLSNFFAWDDLAQLFS
jgi:hypothetical protein